MDEREVKNEYKRLQKNGDYAVYVNNIERFKSIISPKQNIELKAILVGASNHEGALRARSLQLLDKKINQIDASMSKENRERDEDARQFITGTKISNSQSIRRRKLRNKFNKTRRTQSLSPIKEGSKETNSRSRSKSPWKTVKSPRSKSSGWFFGLF